MENIDYNVIIQTVLAALLPIIAGFLAAYVKQWVAVRQKEVELKIGDQWSWAVREAVRIAVNAAEQSQLAGLIDEAVINKKNWAIESARRQLIAMGIDINVRVLADMIEAAVLEEFGGKTDDAETGDATIKVSSTPLG